MAKKQTTKKYTYKELTLEEYDELTLKHQDIGAAAERGNILAELRVIQGQLLYFSRYTNLPSEDDQFHQHANGIGLSIRTIENMPSYEDNVGCRECGSI